MEVSDEVFMLNRPKCILCAFSTWTTVTNIVKKRRFFSLFVQKGGERCQGDIHMGRIYMHKEKLKKRNSTNGEHDMGRIKVWISP